MKITRLLSALTAAAVFLLSSCTISRPSFVKVEDGLFVSEDYPSHYVGTNFWYGAILASEGEGGDIERLEAELDTLKALAESISDKHYLLSSEQRKYLHLAAVLSCNFVNHLMALSYDVLKEQAKQKVR